MMTKHRVAAFLTGPIWRALRHLPCESRHDHYNLTHCVCQWKYGPVWRFLYRIAKVFDPLCRICGHSESNHEHNDKFHKYTPWTKDSIAEMRAILDKI